MYSLRWQGYPAHSEKYLAAMCMCVLRRYEMRNFKQVFPKYGMCMYSIAQDGVQLCSAVNWRGTVC